jgi:yecA family protein
MKDCDNISEDFDEEVQDSQFDWLANIYNSHGAINHPSELHGLMVGEIVGSLRRTASDWLNQVLEHMGVESLDNERHANVTEDLLGFYAHSLEDMDKDSSSFILLLPDDDYALSERVESLVVWVRGFLEGIAISASDRLQKMDSELKEILKDFVDICQIDTRVKQDESGEKEFFEISEYIRIGVLNLYAELNEPIADSSSDDISLDSGSPTLH